MPLQKIGKMMLKVFGSRNERLIKQYLTIASEASKYEQDISQLGDAALRDKTDYFKQKIQNQTSPEQILHECFAVVREVARRNLNMRHFDVQLVGGNVLYQGKIAEMATGEGKTLVATLAAYLVHLTGRKIHIITVNDYLAKRDAEWMRPVYEALGLTVGAIQADMDTGGEIRKEQYSCDITYGTNNEFGFDYLRDNMKMSLQRMVQGDLQYAIIDEVDSILVDEARTPLIISGPAFDDVSRYRKADQVSRQIISLQSKYDSIKKQIDTAERTIANAQGELSQAKKEKDQNRMQKAQAVIDKTESQLDSATNRLDQTVQYYEIEYDRKAAHLTHEGIAAAQEIAGVGSFYTGNNDEWPKLIEQSLRAYITYEREKDYVVMDGKVVIVDDFTGRLMHGRQWSDGLHQAVEAKEGVTVKEESQTLATITLQNFFKLYDQISGMTGTAATEAEEFMNIYGLDTVIIPTDRPCIREDREDIIYKTEKEKFEAIAQEINDISAAGRPVLVGTISIEKSEVLSGKLTRKFGLEHEVLNAKQHEREAHIVEKAGWQHTDRHGNKRGNITIATNMAGRGTDIKLGDGVPQIGGLHILGTERHEARRIDNQLRGRSGRQGDKGSSQFFLSFDDDLMRIFAPEWTIKAFSKVGWEQGQPIYHKWISRGIEKAQKKVEEKNFEIRKNLLEYDEVMDYQRKIFYKRRTDILKGKGLKQIITQMIDSAISQNCDTILDMLYPYRCICEWARSAFSADIQPSDIKNYDIELIDEIERVIKGRAKDAVANKISISMGEYIEDVDDPRSWNLQGICKWAMSSFSVSLSPSKIKYQQSDEIENTITQAALELIDKKDCSQLAQFLRPDFTIKNLAEWANAKFDFKINAGELKDKNPEQIRELLKEKASQKYRLREIEYPVEFAMNMVFTPDGQNVYAYEILSEWIQKKFNTSLSVDQLQQMSPNDLQNKLTSISTEYHNTGLDQEIESKLESADRYQVIEWLNYRFEAQVTHDQLPDSDEPQFTAAVKDIAIEFLRKELADLEKYVLLQVYDGTWKSHLYVMDHLKDSIWMRSFAERDPKVEYKREGFRMFEHMLESIEDRVTDIVFRVHLQAGQQARSVWNVSQTAHDQVGQFSMAERQRAAAQAPQRQVKVKQIKLEKPKVGRNQPCPCGSGKKYKKCCGRE